MLITGGSGSGKTNVLLNLIKQQVNDALIDKIYLYGKHLKYQLLTLSHPKDIGLDLKKFNEQK